MKKSIVFVMVAAIGILSGCGKTELYPNITDKKPGHLCDFENKKIWDTSPDSGFNISLSKEHVTDGAHSLKVVYPVSEYPSINTRKLDRDWSGYEYFCFDVFNPQNETLDFTVRIDDVYKNRANIEIPLKKGKSSVKIPISRISNKIDAGSVTYVVLFLSDPRKRYTIYFDNMRLENKGAEDAKAAKAKREVFNFKMAAWAIDDSVKVKPMDAVQDNNYIWDGTAKTVNIYGAKNEYTAFQLILKASNEDISVSNIEITDLVGPSIIDKSNINLLKEHYLKVTEPSTDMYGKVSLGEGEYPDPLIPIKSPTDGLPFVVKNGRNQPVWADIYIPNEVESGIYKGKITISGNGFEPEEIAINLEVWNFTLPDQTHLKTFFYYGPEQIRQAHKLTGKDDFDYQGIELKYQRLTHQHRMNMSTDVGCYGDWRGFLDRAGLYLSGRAFKEGAGKGVGASLWVVGEEFNRDNKTAFQEACKWYMENFEKAGWADKLFLYVIDEPGDKEAYDEVRKIGQWAHSAPSPGNKLPFMVTEQPKPKKPEFGSLVGAVDIWCSGNGFPEDMDQRRKAGDKIWTYNGGPDGASVIIDTYGLNCRSWAWTAWRYNIEGWFLWDCTYWVDKHNLRGQEKKQTDLWSNPLTFDQRRNPKTKWPDWGNGDGTFLYPGYEKGIDGPISSFRMKAFRRGMQDYEYLYMLKELGKADVADTAARQLDFKTNKDPEKWYEVRLNLANEILKALKEKGL